METDYQWGEIPPPTTALQSLIDSCGFTYINPLISELYPLENVRGEFGTRNYSCYITTEEVFVDLNKDGLFPMNATELFTFCKSRNWVGQWLMALGSEAQFGGTTRYVGVYKDGEEFRTSLGWKAQKWHDCYSFGYVLPPERIEPAEKR